MKNTSAQIWQFLSLTNQKYLMIQYSQTDLPQFFLNPTFSSGTILSRTDRSVKAMPEEFFQKADVTLISQSLLDQHSVR